MQTNPNSGVPAGLRKRLAVDVSGATGHAAGVLYIAPDGDVLMLRRSSAEKNFAGHWALPGGGVEDGETPTQGALRESREEMGLDVDEAGMKLLDRRMTPTGKAFHTYARPVAEKFVPKLNDEHTGYAWAPLSMLPRPLHPAVETTLKERVGMADDMTPEDWSGLRDGFLKWTAEEEQEDEHIATDSALRLALDRNTVRQYSKDGHLHVLDANICKATVSPYRGAEIPNAEALGLDPNQVYQLLRPPEELEKAVGTFNGKPLLRKHEPTTAEDHQKDETIGATGTTARWEDPYIKNGLVVWPQGDIDAVENESKKELSPGYHYRAEMTPGNFRGMRYDGVMRDIVGNHVALVKDGRQGPDVVVGDSMENLMAKPTRLAAVALGLTARILRPAMALDAKPVDLMPIFKDLTTKNFATSKPHIIKALGGVKLAKDASLDGVIELLDAIENTKKEGADDAATEEQMGAMASPVEPMAPTSDYAKDAEPLRNFLKGKGMGEDDIKAACDLMPKALAGDEDETDEEKAEKKKKADEDKAAKDAEMKNMVTKPAMDAAIDAAVTATSKRIRDEQNAVRAAVADVRPYVGELSPTLALDSAADVYRHALTAMGVKGAKDIHESALKTVLDLQPRLGARPTERNPLAMDSADGDAVADFHKRFPGSERITAA